VAGLRVISVFFRATESESFREISHIFDNGHDSWAIHGALMDDCVTIVRMHSQRGAIKHLRTLIMVSRQFRWLRSRWLNYGNCGVTILYRYFAVLCAAKRRESILREYISVTMNGVYWELFARSCVNFGKFNHWHLSSNSWKNIL